MKKFLSLILCAAVIAPVTVSAATISADESTAEISGEFSQASDTVNVPFSAKNGDKVTLYLTVKNSQSVSGLHTKINYNQAYLMKKDIVNYYENSFSYSKNGNMNFSVLFSQGGVNLTSETNIAAVTFTVTKDISESDKVLDYTVTEFYNSSLAELNHKNVGCKIQKNAALTTPSNPVNPTTPTTPVTPISTKNIYGDLDCDGTVKSSDSLLVLRNSVGLEQFDDTQKILANVDGDNSITSADALEILRYSVKLPSSDIIGKELK